MLRTLLYVSKSSIDRYARKSQVARIVATSQAHNAICGVTGALVSNMNGFAQILEGPDGSIDYLMNRILKDRRHEDVRIVQSIAIKKRRFPAWSMAYCGDSIALLRATELLISEMTGADAKAEATERLYRLMEEFSKYPERTQTGGRAIAPRRPAFRTVSIPRHAVENRYRRLD